MSYTKWRNLTLNAKIQTDKKYLILKMGSYLISTAGLGWYIIYVLYGIKFALENDFIPVVDWKNCKLPQYDTAKVGKENIWEYYFEQPFNISLEQAYESNDFFVIDDVEKFAYQNTINSEKLSDYYDEEIMSWRAVFQQYVRLKSEVEDYFEQCKRKLDLNEENFVGVLARGTDYMTLKPIGHLKAISREEIFNHIDQCKNHGKIFLATEDEEILKAFEDKYKEDLYSVDAKRYKCLGNDLLNNIYKEDGYERDLNYLYSLYIISKSPICICAACGGGILVSLMRKEEGKYYAYLCHGYNRAKGIIVGSYVEKEQNKIVFVAGKPLMYYALNTLKLLDIEEVDIIVSNDIKAEYKKKIGEGEQFGLKINFIISDTYDISIYLTEYSDFIESSRVVLLYADYIIHGKDVVKELSEKVNTLDGTYVWGMKKDPLSDTENVIDYKNGGIPNEILKSRQTGEYSLAGRFVFDFDLKEIVRQIRKTKNEFAIVDILNEYIKKRKLFFIGYTRGIISLKVENNDTLEKVDQLIKLLEEFQRQKIGDFEAFRIERL